jgi:hypothetical protein
VLYDNSLSGSIPLELGNLLNLIGFWAQDNSLSGSIPPQLGNLSNLILLSLSNNSLSGSIPPELGGLSSLLYLYLYGNSLSGSIPTELGDLSSLQYLYLHGNILSGTIPNTLQDLNSLEDGFSDLRWNALYTDDAALASFLTSKQNGGDWVSTQTIAPGNFSAQANGTSSIDLAWDPIPYSTDPGGYEIWEIIAGEADVLITTTTGKTASGITISGLIAGTNYSFYISTKTDNHPNNQNTVWSEFAGTVSVTTDSVTTTTTTTTTSTTTTSTTTTLPNPEQKEGGGGGGCFIGTIYIY